MVGCVNCREKSNFPSPPGLFPLAISAQTPQAVFLHRTTPAMISFPLLFFLLSPHSSLPHRGVYRLSPSPLAIFPHTLPVFHLSTPQSLYTRIFPHIPLIFTLPSASNKRFSGFKSRCTIKLPWQYSTALTICLNNLRASFSFTFPRATISSNGHLIMIKRCFNEDHKKTVIHNRNHCSPYNYPNHPHYFSPELHPSPSFFPLLQPFFRGVKITHPGNFRWSTTLLTLSFIPSTTVHMPHGPTRADGSKTLNT